MIVARVAVFGGDEVRAAVTALGLEVAADDPQVAVVDARDRDQLLRAAALTAAIPRVTIVDGDDQPYLAALGIDGSRIVGSSDPAVLGPALLALLPAPTRGRTRVAIVTGVCGGVGRTLLIANLARRISRRLRVCVIDATGTGAAAWWLGASPRPWSEVEPIAQELTSEQVQVIGDACGERLRVVGGPLVAPSEAALRATVRAAATLDDLILVDAPITPAPITAAMRADADRYLVLAPEDAPSQALLMDDSVGDDDWLIASASKARAIAGRPTFRALPRDDAAVRYAMSARQDVRGALGRAYDDLAQVLAIDATDA